MKEEKVKRGYPFSDTAVIALFLAILFGFSVFGILLPDRDFSESENRGLASFPPFSAERLMDGKWMAELSTYLSDQMPMRDALVAVHVGCELFLGKQENGGVLFGKNGYLFSRNDYPSIDNLKSSLSSLSRFAAYAESLGIPTHLAVAGRKIDVETRYLPNFYGRQTQDQLWEAIDRLARECKQINYLNLRDALCLSPHGKQMYYRTDHHWTAYGAFEAYRAIGEKTGLRARQWDFFTEEIVSKAFYGTDHSTSMAMWIKPDSMVYLRWQGDEALTTELPNGKRLRGFYDRERLEAKDKYASFFGGNYGIMRIRADREGREKLLVIKDSFAHAVLPLLGADYDMDVIDPRYYTGLPVSLLDEGGYDAVLVLCSAELLTEALSEDGALPLALLEAGLT